MISALRDNLRTQELTGCTASGWFIYDGVKGGPGFARAIYEKFEALTEHAHDQLRDCHYGQPNGWHACTFNEHDGDRRPVIFYS